MTISFLFTRTILLVPGFGTCCNDIARSSSAANGQITIPREIRERLGLLLNSEVEFELDGDNVRIRKARRVGGAALTARMRRTATTRMRTDEILKLTRGG